MTEYEQDEDVPYFILEADARWNAWYKLPWWKRGYLSLIGRTWYHN